MSHEQELAEAVALADEAQREVARLLASREVGSDPPISGTWTIHICEGHHAQDCVFCGVFDAVTVMDKRWWELAIEERNAALDTLEKSGLPLEWR